MTKFKVERKPERIPLFLKMLEEVWLENPYLRFGQLYYGIMDKLENKGISEDGFYAEEDDWLEAIRKFREDSKNV